MLLTLIAQAADSFPVTTDYATSTGDAQAAVAAMAGVSILFGVMFFLVIIPLIAGMWKIFVKAGRPGWHSIIPFYNTTVLLNIVGKPEWWFLFMFLPLINSIVGIIMLIELAKSFGKSTGFTLALIFLTPIAILMLGFGGAKYVGPGGKPTTLTVPEVKQA
jgi:hypothetical protein